MQAYKLQLDRLFQSEKAAMCWQAVQRLPLAWWQRLANALLLACLAIVAAQAFWLLVPQTQLPPMSGKPVDALQQAASSEVNLSELKGLRLFGSARKVPMQVAVAPPAILNAEETRLELVLQGVISSNVPEEARAIIAHKNAQAIFAPGDDIPMAGQVSLVRVFADRAIINNDGHYESLWLYDEQGKRKIVRQTPAPARRVSPAAPPQTNKTPVHNGDAAPHATSSVRTISPQELNTASSFDDVIKFTMEREGNQIIGYRIGPGRARALFDKAGFKNNDIVTTVNGVPLNDPSKALSIYRQIRSSNSASFGVLRDGETMTIDVTLDDSNV